MQDDIQVRQVSHSQAIAAPMLFSREELKPRESVKLIPNWVHKWVAPKNKALVLDKAGMFFSLFVLLVYVMILL